MKRERTSWSIDLPPAFGIPVRIHYTFFLLLAWIAIEASSQGSPVLAEVLFVITIFGCVLAHELGHSLTALRFGIKTSDIVLYPFGGVASIVKEAPPKQELLIALAGPFVNVVIAAALYPYTVWYSALNDTAIDVLISPEFTLLDRIFVTNILLAVFNLFPAFPMDGGRVLRALLAILGLKSATLVSARISQLLSLGLGALAIYSGALILGVIAVFVFINASQTVWSYKVRNNLRGLKALDAITPESALAIIPHGASCNEALQIVSGSSHDFHPVTHGETVLGIISTDDIQRLVNSGHGDSYLSGHMNKDLKAVAPSLPLEYVSEYLTYNYDLPLIVLDRERFIGIITPRTVFDIIAGKHRFSSPAS